MKIKEYCESNENFRLLLDVFTQSYMGMYNDLKVPQRKEIKIYLHRNFGFWFYSNLDQFGEASPANFINSDIAHSFEEAAMTFPICEPVYTRSKLVDIKYKFQVFSLENHPFIKDMETLIKVLLDYEFPDENGLHSLTTEDMHSILDNPDSDFAFRELTYLDTLTQVCRFLSLLDWDVQCSRKLKVHKENYDEFFGSPTKVQILKIVDVIIDAFTTTMRQSRLIKKIPTAKQLRSLFEKGVYVEMFLKKIFSEVMKDTSLEDLYDKVQEYKDDNFDDEFDKETLEELLPYTETIMKISYLSGLAHRYLFLPFGQYLQLIQPLYHDAFTHKRDAEHLNTTAQIAKGEGGGERDEEIAAHVAFVNYMTPPDLYKLSPLGVELFKNGKPEKKPMFNNIPHDESQAVLEEMLNAPDDEDFDFLNMLLEGRATF